MLYQAEGLGKKWKLLAVRLPAWQYTPVRLGWHHSLLTTRVIYIIQVSEAFPFSATEDNKDTEDTEETEGTEDTEDTEGNNLPHLHDL